MPITGFKGTWTALVTPFNQDYTVDYEGLRRNIEFQIAQGITGILPVGTTGESPTLNETEHFAVIKRAREFAKDRCDLLAGAGSNCTEEAYGYCRSARESGIDKVLLVDCYYNCPSSRELRDEYYRALLNECKDLNIVIYVIPGRTGTAISAEDIAILRGECDRVIAIKEATGDLKRMERERALMPDISIMSGDDDKTFEMMSNPQILANGVISVMTNIVPGSVAQMVEALLAGRKKEAQTIVNKLKPLFSVVTVKVKSKRILPDGREVYIEDRFRNPSAIKTIMNVLGMPAGPSRRPLGKMTLEGIEVVRDSLKTVAQQSREVLTPIEDFYRINIEERIYNENLWEKYVFSSQD